MAPNPMFKRPRLRLTSDAFPSWKGLRVYRLPAYPAPATDIVSLLYPPTLNLPTVSVVIAGTWRVTAADLTTITRTFRTRTLQTTYIDDEESNDTGDFDDDYDDFDIEDQVQLFDGNLYPREYYLKQLKEFNEAAFDDEDYSEGSTILLDGIEELWNKYYAWFEYDPQESFESVSLGSLYNFFDWLLGQKAGKNGRKKRGTKKSSSLGTYWKVYWLVYEKPTGAKLDAKLNQKMHRVLKKLAKKHGLSD
ncbi:hypothetical protein B0T26DRAFT_747161 [Lasiosphaeria miniovina]|uniref:Uncharacterized protein n=1 Tax=Lasiosphaeria miniovina TaxID=1954250 RepID=A0AA40B327_9PEZI|nr:uncharacterized protein B0T26DRAFT_747161 [Lasiosphaeria miniovina]KAK0726751.1 hypothetical protein B0T26DRAFT_747161 [Lasiosphaeria miniovina]